MSIHTLYYYFVSNIYTFSLSPHINFFLVAIHLCAGLIYRVPPLRINGNEMSSQHTQPKIAFTKITRINSQEYEVKLVDTAGQDEYSIFPTQYSMDFHGYVLVYSITSQKSFEVIQIIYEKLLDVMGKAQ